MLIAEILAMNAKRYENIFVQWSINLTEKIINESFVQK